MPPLAGALAGALVAAGDALVDAFVLEELLFDVTVLFTIALVDCAELLVFVDVADPLVLELRMALVAAAEEVDAEGDAEGDAEDEGVPEAEAEVADATVLELSITKYGL